MGGGGRRGEKVSGVGGEREVTTMTNMLQSQEKILATRLRPDSTAHGIMGRCCIHLTLLVLILKKQNIKEL